MILLEPAKYLLFHGVIILLFALIAGFPYAKSILKKEADNIIFAWRVAHAALTMGGMLLMLVAVILTFINMSVTLMWVISLLFITSGYAFLLALYLSPISGHRGLIYRGNFSAKLVYLSNTLGAITSFIGTVLLLYAIWKIL